MAKRPTGRPPGRPKARHPRDVRVTIRLVEEEADYLYRTLRPGESLAARIRRCLADARRWYTVEYDENSLAWLMADDKGRICLEHGMQVAVTASARTRAPLSAPPSVSGAGARQ